MSERSFPRTVAAVLGSAAVVAGCLFVSCRQLRETAVVLPEIHRDTLLTARLRVDTFRLTDSIFESVRTSGDTVFRYRHRERTVFRDRIVSDTVVRTRTDTVTLPPPLTTSTSRPAATRRPLAIAALGLFLIAWLLAKRGR